MARKPERIVTFDHDTYPDFSWLEQDQYNPSHPDYQPVYPTRADMRRKRNAYPGDWYRNPANHVALQMTVYEVCPTCGERRVVDSMGNIDFLADSDDWQTGTFRHLSELKGSPYLKSLAKDAGLPR